MASQPRESEVQAKAAKAKELRNKLIKAMATFFSYEERKAFREMKAFLPPLPSLEEMRNMMPDNWHIQLRTDEDQQRFIEPLLKKYLKNTNDMPTGRYFGTARRAKGGLIKKSKVKKKSKKKTPVKKRRTRRKKKA